VFFGGGKKSMPELPEVETLRRALAPDLIDKTIRKTAILDARLRSLIAYDLPDILQQQTILAVDRRSKYLLWKLKNGVLLIHLGMTGCFRWLSALAANKHDKIAWQIEEKWLVFQDVRRFGRVLWWDGKAPQPLLAQLGPEPLSADFSAAYAYEAAQHRRIPLKILLMDAKFVVGIGNIYASESLFYAKQAPQRLAASLTLAEWQGLIVAVQAVLTAALASGGSSIRDFQRVNGESGYFQHQFAVYQRAGLPCKVCATPIVALRQAGRSTFFCPQCQA
jgi:formamidopyrimidine-DNA glycosylase